MNKFFSDKFHKTNKIKNYILVNIPALLAILLLFIFSFQNKDEITSVTSEISTEKPWTYWWWMGSAVDTANITYNLGRMKKAGLGGVHIIPIYGVKGVEDQFIDFMSPEWQKMLQFTCKKAEGLGLGVDMTLGTGWCFGGKQVNLKTGLKAIRIDTVSISGRQKLDLSFQSEYPINQIIHILAVSEAGRFDVTEKITSDNWLDWHGGDAMLFITRLVGPVFKVKRAAPGGEGFMLNPFSAKAFHDYTKFFDSTSIFNNKNLRAIYHDSYEYYGANWTEDLFSIFEKRRKYDLRMFIPELTGKDDHDITPRIIADYRQTLAELHLEYVERINKYAEQNDCIFRNEGHGSPANWLDVYAAASIPETETFGAAPFSIPGLTREKEFIRQDIPNRFVLKFASSAANFNAKKLVSCETHTWLREHFRVALSHCKPELDQLFVSGINHVFYHGTAYSPHEAKWPGWLFYASTNFAPSNSFYHHFPALNQYIKNCQQILQTGQPDHEILVYFPVQDIWHSKPENLLYQLSVHNYHDWLEGTGFHNTIKLLDSLSYTFDYCSDNQLLQLNYSNGQLITPRNSYKVLLIPECKFMPRKTLKKIHQLAQRGAHIIMHRNLPQSYAGYYDWQHYQAEFDRFVLELSASSKKNFSILNDQELPSNLQFGQVKTEVLTSYKLDFLRSRYLGGFVYFITNLHAGKRLREYIPLGIKATYYEIYDPVTGNRSLAKTKLKGGQSSILLDLKPGQSLFIFTRDKDPNLPGYPDFKAASDTIMIDGEWKIEFIKGGPVLPESVVTDTLISWTGFNGSSYQYFSGLARYTTNFNLPKIDREKGYLLTFSEVRESAKVILNGKELPTLFAFPYERLVTDYLKEGTNEIVVEVANLSANHIRYLDMKGVNWQHFYDINFVNIHYEKFDASVWDPMPSGLIGPVSILME